jgi:hypothetical protein
MLCRLLFNSSYFAVMVIALTTDTQNLTLQADWIGIFVLGDENVFHFVSLAKNTVAFFRISLSISKRSIRALSLRF